MIDKEEELWKVSSSFDPDIDLRNVFIGDTDIVLSLPLGEKSILRADLSLNGLLDLMVQTFVKGDPTFPPAKSLSVCTSKYCLEIHLNEKPTDKVETNGNE